MATKRLRGTYSFSKVHYPNNRCCIPQAERKKRIMQFLKNVWTARPDIGRKLNKVDPPILSADQIPQHQNKSSCQKSPNFSVKGRPCFVKENHHLSRERCIVMKIASFLSQINTSSLEFVFKGKGKRVKLNPLDKLTTQWTEKGSYRLENILKYIEPLPSIPVKISPEERCMFTLDDYSPDVKQTFRKITVF